MRLRVERPDMRPPEVYEPHEVEQAQTGTASGFIIGLSVGFLLGAAIGD